MYTRAMCSVVTLMGLAAISLPATAANYTVDCGTNGSSDLVQNQLAAMSRAHNTLSVSGTCAGDLEISGLDDLSISGLSLSGTLSVFGATHVSLQGLTLDGGLATWDRASLTVSNSTVNGYIQLTHGSTGSFTNMTVTGTGGLICVSSSECSFWNTNVSGVPSGDPTTASIGIQVGSASRLNFGSGRISGFDWGVHVWNNATVFFSPSCDNVSIDSNTSIGVYVRDGGMVKLEGTPPPAPGGCAAGIVIANNGNYGLLAEGTGLAFLYRTQIVGHAIDSIRVQNGSVVKVRTSSIGAATSGRSARVKSHSHLWFDEEIYGPAAGSTLAGPVCVTNNSSVDTDNSSTQLTTVTQCSTP